MDGVKGRQHKLWAAELEGQELYFCMRCGCYAELSARKLAPACTGHANRGAREKLARNAKRKHPHGG